MLEAEFRIGDKTVGGNTAAYVIAEAGSNHNQSLDTARKMIDVAAEAGCDCVKFQLFDAAELYPSTHELYAIFKSMELSPDWLETLLAHARSRGIDFTASVFDRRSTDRLLVVGVPFVKIASSETTRLDLLAYVASKKVPLVVSTGMCDIIDVMEAVACSERNHNSKVALMQCVALYPVEPGDANLAVMDTLRRQFACPVGFSDHTLGIDIAVAAAARGANVIEKHFTLDRTMPGPDHSYAIEPAELSQMVRQIRLVGSAIGDGRKEMHLAEKPVGRREGLYARMEIEKGATIVPEMLEIRRPAVGIRARHAAHAAGLRALRTIPAGAPVAWEDVGPSLG